MITKKHFKVDEQTIRKVGLKLSHKPVIAQIAPNTRVFEYPYLDNVFVMETDFYGNPMPKNSCFLAFYGPHGFIGKDLEIETLKNARVEDIKKVVENNT